MDFSDPACVPVVWLTHLHFLRENASLRWAEMMHAGWSFTLSPQARRQPGIQARATYLAEAELRRLERARLYHLDPVATATSKTTVSRMQDVRELVPSTSGLLVWSQPVHHDDGVGIIAASWGPADDGGLWISWWSDAAAAARHVGWDADTVVQTDGHLALHQETHILPMSWPPAADEPTDPGYPIFSPLFGAWQAMANETIIATEQPVRAAIRKQARAIGVQVAPVLACTAIQAPLADTGASIPEDGLPDARIVAEPYQWIEGLYEATAWRIAKIEYELRERFPGIFELLNHEAARENPDWPRWCWLPLQRVADILEENYPDPSSAGFVHRTRHLAILAAVAAWKASGCPVVHPHTDLQDRTRPGIDVLPADLPARLPVHCLYVTFPTLAGSLGWFVFAEWNPNEQRSELTFVFDTHTEDGVDNLTVQPLHLVGQSVREALSATQSAMLMRLMTLSGQDGLPVTGPGTEFDAQIDQLLAKIGPQVALVDFLSSPDAEFLDTRVLLGLPSTLTWPPPPVERPIQLWLLDQTAVNG
ncbi:hypothetical protein D5S17_35960 [Pseudonocardiaceae bacterium YIM PH 21723]|nr:hypothetical protein D5S17_35960 [Pseudonocardiaceae bacterium YIM PH 21723]